MVERRAGALGPGQARSRQRRWPKARLYKGQAEPAIIATSRHGLLSLPFSGYRTCPRGTAPTLRTLAGYPREPAKSHKNVSLVTANVYYIDDNSKHLNR